MNTEGGGKEGGDWGGRRAEAVGALLFVIFIFSECKTYEQIKELDFHVIIQAFCSLSFSIFTNDRSSRALFDVDLS